MGGIVTIDDNRESKPWNFTGALKEGGWGGMILTSHPTAPKSMAAIPWIGGSASEAWNDGSYSASTEPMHFPG
jgi:hypothetical protein